MGVYCFKCPRCGQRAETSSRDVEPFCMACADRTPNDSGVFMVRDYRAEGVGLGSGVKVSRDGTNLDQARAFLPSNENFKGPGDPDGTKGMREWHERFEPRADNPRPIVPGRIERRSF